jgi:hypothetical protein
VGWINQMPVLLHLLLCRMQAAYAPVMQQGSNFDYHDNNVREHGCFESAHQLTFADLCTIRCTTARQWLLESAHAGSASWSTLLLSVLAAPKLLLLSTGTPPATSDSEMAGRASRSLHTGKDRAEQQTVRQLRRPQHNPLL